LAYAQENAATRKLYASVGFVETGEIDDDDGEVEIVARFVL